MTLWAAPAVALITGLGTSISLRAAKRYLSSQHILDIPSQRSSHTQPTVRGAGIGIVMGLLIGLACAAPLLVASGPDLLRVAIMAATVATIASIGFLEDLQGLRVRSRLAGQVSIFGVATTALILTGNLPVEIGLLAWLGGIFYVNATNFMDGANGISSLHGTITGGYYALIGAILGHQAMEVSGVVLSVAFLMFLPWNVGRSRVFMGDAGSYALGAGAWSMAVWAAALGTSPMTALAPLIIYMTDVLLTLARRAARRSPLGEAHHEHVYQRLMPFFQTHTIPTTMTTVASLACALFGLWRATIPDTGLWPALCALIVACTYFLSPGPIHETDALANRGLVDERA